MRILILELIGLLCMCEIIIIVYLTYFDSFGVEHIPKKIKAFINNKNIITNIFRIQGYDSIMCGYFCTGFINLMLTGKNLYTNLFSPNNFKENDDIILNYFMSNI